MELFKIQAIKNEITPKIELGDYITLGKMLGIPQNTARMRFKRDNPEAVEAMKFLINNRFEMIETYQSNI